MILLEFSCPRCDLGVVLKKDTTISNLILVCDTCLWYEEENGKEYKKRIKLHPVKTSILLEKNYIDKGD